MSDVTVAPQGGAPAAAPSANEVVIDRNPVSTPTPVGSQAPDKPAGDFDGSKHRPPSRSETVRAAFERAEARQRESAERNQQPPQRQREAPKPRPAAEAKPGHNNPPEETPRERTQQPQQQHREQGRFARAPDAQQQAGNQQAAQQAGQQQHEQLPPDVPYREPLRRMSDAGKAEWSRTPESVRADVYRMANEFNGAYKRYQADTQAMEPIRRFHDMAQQHGTTLEKALTNYVSMEQKLREDVVGGLDIIVRNLNLRSPEGQQLDLRDIAYHILNMSPDQHRLTQAQNAQAAQHHQIGSLHQQIADLKNAVMQMHNQQQFGQTRGVVEQYAEQHPRFDELGDLIEAEIKLGFTLDQAYRRAELLRPATHAAQTRTSSAQTRQPDRSISGAPSGSPSNGSARSERKGPPPSRRDAIQNAINRVNGSV